MSATVLQDKSEGKPEEYREENADTILLHLFRRCMGQVDGC